MRTPSPIETAIAQMQERGHIDPDLQLLQCIQQQAVQARRALAQAYWGKLGAFVRSQLRHIAALRQTATASSTRAEGTPCPH